jgi:hypothetical protein
MNVNICELRMIFYGFALSYFYIHGQVEDGIVAASAALMLFLSDSLRSA